MANGRTEEHSGSLCPRRCKDGYQEIMMILGDVICGRVKENGQIQVRIYNDNNKHCLAHFLLRPDRTPHIPISSFYSVEISDDMTDLVTKNMEFIMAWAVRKKTYKRYSSASTKKTGQEERLRAG